jgi:hypothetical protein
MIKPINWQKCSERDLVLLWQHGKTEGIRKRAEKELESRSVEPDDDELRAAVHQLVNDPYRQ